MDAGEQGHLARERMGGAAVARIVGAAKGRAVSSVAVN
jgi:hypothetical protein